MKASFEMSIRFSRAALNMTPVFIFLGQYFDMNKKNCRESFEIYKNFLSRVDKVGNFFKVAEVW